MALTANIEHARRVAETLLDWYERRDGLLSGADLPESEPPEGMRIGSYEHIMFLTMTVSINYQRSANALWDAARRTWADQTLRWVFCPKDVAGRTGELTGALARHGLGKGQNDAWIWGTVSGSFARLFDGDPRNLFEKFGYDAHRIVTAMRSEYGREFPYLAGATGTGKIRSLWIRMLHKEARVEFENLHKVPIPIDIHTGRCTVTTGCLTGSFEGGFSQLAEMSKQAWSDVCEGTGYYPLELDEALWNLGRFGCSRYSDEQVSCPVRRECRLERYCTANDPSSSIRIEQNSITTIRTSLPGGRVAVVTACGRYKETHALPAHMLYKSNRIKNVYRLKGENDMFVLSAKYGLVPADKVIEPYDRLLDEKRSRELIPEIKKVVEGYDAIVYFRPGARSLYADCLRQACEEAGTRLDSFGYKLDDVNDLPGRLDRARTDLGDADSVQDVQPRPGQNRQTDTPAYGSGASDGIVVTTATAVWIATATLHRERGGMAAFYADEIGDMVQKQDLCRSTPFTIKAHIGVHCVANTRADSTTHRKLYQTRGMYRLYRDGDDYDPSRAMGPAEPTEAQLPERYRHLIRWYHDEYQ